ncbi:MAG: hypothetical protein P8P01_04555 [Schleiferiaceae bacterium]|nr:hypothetical protein [Schleiferiaceae bacterium]
MKRRILSLIALTALLFSATACGGAKDCDCPSFGSIQMTENQLA